MNLAAPSPRDDRDAAVPEGAARETVLFVTRKWPPAVGGMETYCVKLTEALRRHAKVRILALPGRADGAPPGAFALLVFGLATALRLLLRRGEATVVHVGDVAAWPLAFCARLRAPRRPVAISAHGTDVGYARRAGLKGWLYRQYLRLGARLLPGAALIANSAATARAVEAAGFPRPAVIPLATDIHGDPVTGEHDDRILFAGRLIPLKGCGWFIREVLPRLPEDLTLAVAGTVWDEAEGRALKHPRVRFLGSLGEAALQQAYRSALCVVAPNIATPDRKFEGFGLVATEAVRDGETGFRLPSGDAEGKRLAGALCVGP